MRQNLIPDPGMTRREFLTTTASAAGAAVLVGLQPGQLLAANPAFESDPYNDRTVARVYDPRVSSFDFSAAPDKNFYYRTFDVERLESMLGTALQQLTGTANAALAWRMIMPGVSSKSKVAVKININCAHESNGDHGAYWASAPNTSPRMMAALAKSLEEAGLEQENITFFDRSRTFEAEWKADLHARCPRVKALGKGEVAGSGTSIVLNNDLPPVDIPLPLMQADYLINLHLLKKHYSGVTGALKNLLGLSGNVGRIAHQGGSREFHTGTLLRELSMNGEIRKRAVLCISEAVFGNHLPTENVRPLDKTDVFPNGKPSSLIVSRSPFFQDLVLLHFINYEMTGNVKTICSGARDGWLRNCLDAVPNFTSDCMDSVSLADSPAGSGLPPKDLAYRPSTVRYLSIARADSLAAAT
jgi:Domain of unknown function (DUF362)